MSWVTLCELAELVEGEGKYVEIDGFRLAVFLDQGAPYVIDNYCPHAGGNLSAGPVRDGCAICPWHAWAFRLDTGELRGAPGVTVSTYRTRQVQPEGRPTLLQADLPIY